MSQSKAASKTSTSDWLSRDLDQNAPDYNHRFEKRRDSWDAIYRQLFPKPSKLELYEPYKSTKIIAEGLAMLVERVEWLEKQVADK